MPQSDDASTSRTRAFPVAPTLLGAALLAIVQYVASEPFYSTVTRLCASLTLAVLAVLATRYLVRRPRRLPWIELLYFAHYTQFGLATTVDPSPVGVMMALPRAESHEGAALLAFASGLAMVASFAIASRVLAPIVTKRNALVPNLDAHTLAAAAPIYTAVSAAYVVVTTAMPSLRPPAGIAFVVDSLFGQRALVATAAAAFLTEPTRSTRASLLLALLALLVSLLLSSMIYLAVLPLVGLGILWWQIRRRVPIAPALAAVALIVVLQPLKSYYRDATWGGTSNRSIGESVEAWGHAFDEYQAERRSGFGSAASPTDGARQRVNTLTQAAYVMDTVPVTVPHDGPEVYSVLLYSMIPRLIWPEKPNMTKAGVDQATIALDLTSSEMAEKSTTGISLTIHGYFAHGIAGSIGWMCALGAMLAGLDCFFGTTLAGTIAGILVLMTLPVQIEGGFINTFGGTWQVVALATATPWLLHMIGRLRRPERTTRRAAQRAMV